MKAEKNEYREGTTLHDFALWKDLKEKIQAN